MSSYEVGSPKPSIHLSKSLPTPPLIQPPLLLIFVLCYSYLHMRACVCLHVFQVVVCRAADVGGGVAGDQSQPDAAAEPADGQRHCVVPPAVGQDLPAGGREALRAGEFSPSPSPARKLAPRVPQERLTARRLVSPQISIPLSTAFGADTEGAQWIVGYLLEKVINNLSVWSSEAELANDTVDLLVTLVEKRER